MSQALNGIYEVIWMHIFNLLQVWLYCDVEISNKLKEKSGREWWIIEIITSSDKMQKKMSKQRHDIVLFMIVCKIEKISFHCAYVKWVFRRNFKGFVGYYDSSTEKIWHFLKTFFKKNFEFWRENFTFKKIQLERLNYTIHKRKRLCS